MKKLNLLSTFPKSKIKNRKISKKNIKLALNYSKSISMEQGLKDMVVITTMEDGLL